MHFIYARAGASHTKECTITLYRVPNYSKPFFNKNDDLQNHLKTLTIVVALMSRKIS